MKMKNIVYFLLALALMSCQNEPKDYVSISGQITDKNSDSVVIRNRTFSKTIPVNEDGTNNQDSPDVPSSARTAPTKLSNPVW